MRLGAQFKTPNSKFLINIIPQCGTFQKRKDIIFRTKRPTLGDFSYICRKSTTTNGKIH